MIAPLELEWDELLVYHQLYLRCDLSTMIVRYTDRQIEDSLKGAKIGRTRIRNILDRFIENGLFVEIAKGTKGRKSIPAIGKLIKINEISQALNEPKTNLKQSLDTPLIKDKRIKKDIYSEIVERFNSTCTGLSKVIKITDKRKKTINARLKEYKNDKEVIFKVFDIVSKNSFLNGNNNINWEANFDWILKSENFVKILEGLYKDTKQPIQVIEKPKEEFSAFGTDIRI